jgi:hypothetical protein
MNNVEKSSWDNLADLMINKGIINAYNSEHLVSWGQVYKDPLFLWNLSDFIADLVETFKFKPNFFTNVSDKNSAFEGQFEEQLVLWLNYRFGGTENTRRAIILEAYTRTDVGLKNKISKLKKQGVFPIAALSIVRLGYPSKDIGVPYFFIGTIQDYIHSKRTKQIV